MLTVERLDDGEVSPYLVDELRRVTRSSFAARSAATSSGSTTDGGPLLLVAGGSGVVPLRAMLRHRRAVGSEVPVRLLYSSRTLDDVIYRDELDAARADGVEVVHTLTREQPQAGAATLAGSTRSSSTRSRGRRASDPLTYVCGPTSFVETAASELVGLGHDPTRIRTERFGPSERDGGRDGRRSTAMRSRACSPTSSARR